MLNASAQSPDQAAPPSAPTQHESQESNGEPLGIGISLPATKKKSKKRSKTTAQRGPTALPKGRGTGFEEYFADPPLTPGEADEEKYEIYALEVPFEDRIQSCVQRFRARRRLQGKMTVYFNEYLFLGGIDTNSNAFGGQDPRDLKDLTPAQRREVTAHDAVYTNVSAGDRFYDGDKDKWVVDFTGVAKGFLSTAMPANTGLDDGQVKLAVNVVDAFLRYVLQHDVCPEHEDDVNGALQACQQARVEWPLVAKLRTLLPGKFNEALVELYATYRENEWSPYQSSDPEGLDPRAVLFSSFALMEDEEETFRSLCAQEQKVDKEFDGTFEIVDIARPTEEIVQRFKQLRIGDSQTQVPPIGTAMLKPTATIKSDWVLPKMSPKLDKNETVKLFVDDGLLALMLPGMRISCTLCELTCGMRFIKALNEVVPSFYTYLPQNMMRHYKQPAETTRPAPSVHSPDVDEAQGDDE
ncbi:hypothetical protein S7711_06483 [Stachybotrys chartarum IBT 7711]|uniref:Argonaute siRNA chaperone complex subunit Arb1 n=1 Tax=Stachybotrys chartarum (strain CBS 109288 / IBT 7711) TaxID=1280523 RepID=A0A084AXC3_STACB|nr:hypothetical protein S7711_06483 [Stachybotrys chartarum IBT 7711]